MFSWAKFLQKLLFWSDLMVLSDSIFAIGVVNAKVIPLGHPETPGRILVALVAMILTDFQLSTNVYFCYPTNAISIGNNTLPGQKYLHNQNFEPLVPQVAHDRDTMLLH